MAKSLLRQGENIWPGTQAESKAVSHNRTAAVLLGLPLSAQPWAQLCVPGAAGYPAGGWMCLFLAEKKQSGLILNS